LLWISFISPFAETFCPLCRNYADHVLGATFDHR
jgi:hypothetical protein